MRRQDCKRNRATLVIGGRIVPVGAIGAAGSARPSRRVADVRPELDPMLRRQLDEFF